MYENIQWFLMGKPISDKDIQIDYRLEIDGRHVKNIPQLIKSQLDEIEILEYEVNTLQANALKRMDQLQEKIEQYEKVMSDMAKEIRRLKGQENADKEST